MTDIPRPAPGDTDWIDWADDEEVNSDKVAAATSNATASTLILRDSAGRAQVVDGSAASDIATKGQVDARALPADTVGYVAWNGTAWPGTRPSYGSVFFLGGTTRPTIMNSTTDRWIHAA